MDNRHNRKLFENALQEVNQKSQPKQLNEVIGTLIGLGILGGAAYKVAKDWKAAKQARQEESETKALERRALISKIEEPANQRAFTERQNELARQAREAERVADRTFTTQEREAGQTFKSGETEKQIAARQAEQGANRTFTTQERKASEQAARKRAADQRKFQRGEGNKARRERASIRKEEGKKAAAQERTKRQQAAISGSARRTSAQAAARLSDARVENLKAQTAAIDPANRDEVLSLVRADLASQEAAHRALIKKFESMFSTPPAAPSSAPAPSGSSAPKRRTSKKSTATPPAAAAPSSTPAAPSPKKKATKKSTATPSAPPPATGTSASGKKKKISDEPSPEELARMEAVKAAIRAENKNKRAPKPPINSGFDPDEDEDNF